MPLGHGGHDGQAHAHAVLAVPARSGGPIERLAQPGQGLGRDAHALVRHVQTRGIAQRCAPSVTRVPEAEYLTAFSSRLTTARNSMQ